LTADENLDDEKKFFEVEIYKVVYNKALVKLSNTYVYFGIITFQKYYSCEFYSIIVMAIFFIDMLVLLVYVYDQRGSNSRCCIF